MLLRYQIKRKGKVIISGTTNANAEKAKEYLKLDMEDKDELYIDGKLATYSMKKRATKKKAAAPKKKKAASKKKKTK